MKYILIIAITIFSISLNAQTLTKKVAKMNLQIDSLQEENVNLNLEISELKSKIENTANENLNQSKRLDNAISHQSLSSDNLSNQISCLNPSLTFWGIVFSIIGLILAAYISFILNRTLKLLKQSKNLKSELLVLQEDINGNYDKIYEEVTNKEIDSSLKRITFARLGL